MSEAAQKFDEDLLIRKSDRYLEVPDSVIDDLRPRILNAIDNFHCTLFQIKRKAGFEMSANITPVIEALESDGTIRRVYNGVLTAFFRADRVPTKFWMAGNDKVEVDFNPVQKTASQPVANISKVVRDQGARSSISNIADSAWSLDYMKRLAAWGLSREETAKKANVPLSALINKLNQPKLKKAWDEGRKNFGLGKSEGLVINEEKPAEIVAEENTVTFERVVKPGILENPANSKPAKINHYARQIEKAAAFSRTQEETAQKLKLTVHELNRKLRSDPDLKEAYNRGRQQFKDHLENKNKEEKSMYPKKEISETEIEKAAEEVGGKTTVEAIKLVAENLNIGFSTIQAKFLKYPYLREAFDRGRAKFQQKSDKEQSIKVPAPVEVEKQDRTVDLTSADIDEAESAGREKILNAIRNGHRTFSRLKEASGVDFLFIPLIQGLLKDNLIYKYDWAEDTFYDLIENKPAFMETPVEAAPPIAVEPQVETTEISEEANPETELPEINDEIIPEKEELKTIFEGPVDSVPVEALLVSSNRHTELLERIKPEKQVNLATTTPHNSFGEIPSNEESPVQGELLTKASSDASSFGDGGTFEVFADLNLFKMNREQREFMNDIVNRYQEFKEKAA